MEHNSTNTVYNTILPTKKEIIERLFKEERISFDEMWVLLQDNMEMRYVILPHVPTPFVSPMFPENPVLPWTTCSTLKLDENDKN